MEPLLPVRVRNISEVHKAYGVAAPLNELISVINLDGLQPVEGTFILDFYVISLERNFRCPYVYGQSEYNSQKGTVYLTRPGQVIGSTEIFNSADIRLSGWGLYFHPDFLLKTSLARTIRNYDFFGYAFNEALFLIEEEETLLTGLINNIKRECGSPDDRFSKGIIISHLEALLNYLERFYYRQFSAFKITDSQILERMDDVLKDYFESDEIIKSGLPTVQQIAQQLNLSPSYLSGLLKVLTGRNALQHIQYKMIELAKEKISTSELSVNEIAYQLGFNYPQSFSRIFKAKTGLSPLAFRQSLTRSMMAK